MKLTLQHIEDMDDWYVIERAEHAHKEWMEEDEYGGTFRTSARFSDADVEGTGYEMLMIALAIRGREHVEFKRCAVRTNTKKAYFWSPRNSRVEGECTLDEADELASMIERTVKPT